MGRRLRWTVWLCAALLTADAAFAETTLAEGLTTVTLEGSAPGSGGAARMAAIDNAREQAVLEVLEEAVSTADLSAVYPIIEHAFHYVHAFRILDHRQEGGVTWVEVEMDVYQDAIHRDAALLALPHLAEPPKVLLVIVARAESGEGLEEHALLVEALLAEALENQGMEWMGAAELTAYHGADELRAYVADGAPALGRLARIHQADAVVYGEAVCESGEGRGNVRPRKARINAQVLRGSDGLPMKSFSASATVHSTAAALGFRQALEDATHKLWEWVFVGAVLAVVGAESPDSVMITIENVPNQAILDEILVVLESDLGIAGAETLYMSRREARVRIPYSRSLAPLSDAIAARNFQGYRVAPVRVVSREMVLAVESD